MSTSKNTFKDSYSYAALDLLPMAITWNQWTAALEVLQGFYALWKSVALHFDVWDVVTKSVRAYGIVRAA